MSRRSRRMKFAAAQRLRRAIARIERRCAGQPGFAGVATSTVITGPDGTRHFTLGALYIDPAPQPPTQLVKEPHR